MEESGIPALSVRLYHASGWVRTTVTDASGFYSFETLPEGVYRVCVSGVSLTHRQTFDDDFPRTPGCSSWTSLGVGESVRGVDFGYQQRSSITGRIWHDLNTDAAEDDGEPGLGGWTVQLYLDRVVAIVSTTANGLFSFDRLAPGTYRACVAPPSGYVRSVGYFNFDVMPGDCQDIVLSAGDARVHSFGYTTRGTSLATAGDLVWEDIDGDGLRDVREPGLAGIEVTLSRSGDPGSRWPTLTHAHGAYWFSGLPADTYDVCVVVPHGFVNTRPTLSGCYRVTLARGVDLTTLDFGLHRQ